MRGTAIPTRTCGKRDQKINFGKELNIVARAHRARLHEVLMRVFGETGTHEHVQHVMNQKVSLVHRHAYVRGQDAGQIRMAAVMIIAAGEQSVGVRVAACADHVMDSGAIVIPSVPGERVSSDRGQRAQVRQRAPEPVSGTGARCR
jgi:hypothetical protein